MEQKLKEIRTEIPKRRTKKILVEAICPICGEKMETTKDIILTTYPEMYPMICPKCGFKDCSIKHYPYVEEEEISEEEEIIEEEYQTKRIIDIAKQHKWIKD